MCEDTSALAVNYLLISFFSAEEQKQRRRQKILENRSKRQSQEVFPPDSTGIQQELTRVKTSNPPAAPNTISANNAASLEQVPGATNTWNNPTLLSTQDGLSADANTVPKRDIWEIQNSPTDPDGIKRLAFETASARLMRLPDGMGKTKNTFDRGAEMVTSTNPLEDSSSQSSSGGMSNQGLTLPVTICMPSSQISPTGQTAQAGLPVHGASNQYKSMTPAGMTINDDEAMKQKKIESKVLTDLGQKEPKMDCNIIQALSEPCFFNLRPPSLESKAYHILEPEIQHRLMLCVEAYREFCRPMVSIHEKVPQNYVSLLNSGEECYHQLVRFAKRLPEFRALSQDDQIALLKGNVIEIMIVRFSKCYNLETNAWTIPHCGTVQNVSGIIEDDNAMFSEFCIDDYSNFVRAALECCKGDDLILIVLQVITLFWPHIANLEDVASVRAAYTTYLDTLESYLNVKYLDSNMVIEVNKVMGQLRQVGKKAHDVMWKSQVSELHPLLKEMFDLR